MKLTFAYKWAKRTRVFHCTNQRILIIFLASLGSTFCRFRSFGSFVCEIPSYHFHFFFSFSRWLFFLPSFGCRHSCQFVFFFRLAVFFSFPSFSVMQNRSRYRQRLASRMRKIDWCLLIFIAFHSNLRVDFPSLCRSLSALGRVWRSCEFIFLADKELQRICTRFFSRSSRANYYFVFFFAWRFRRGSVQDVYRWWLRWIEQNTNFTIRANKIWLKICRFSTFFLYSRLPAKRERETSVKQANAWF